MFAGSQPFTATQSPIGGGPVVETNKGGGKVEEKQPTLPVTIRSIEVAVAQHSGDGEVLFHGAQPGMLLLVGMVESVSHQAASLEISLNDSTGRIRVRQYGGAEPGDPLAKVVAGNYIMVAGQLRTSPTAHITALNGRIVTSADEISYHMIEAAHAALTLQRGPTDAIMFEKTPQMASPAKVAAPAAAAAAAAAPLAAAAVPVAEAAPGSKAVDVRGAIVAYLQQQAEGKPEGVPLDAVCGQLKTTVASEVRSVLQQLVDDGEAYTTIDDDHFALI